MHAPGHLFRHGVPPGSSYTSIGPSCKAHNGNFKSIYRRYRNEVQPIGAGFDMLMRKLFVQQAEDFGVLRVLPDPA